MMTLEEAIKHCKDVALSCTNKECALEHFQLLKWLQEYNSMLKKQGKQKLADKIVPKFHEGDWVVNAITGDVEQIIEVTNNEYICSGTLIVSFDNQHLLKKWTIQDAKDGDVLCTYECDKPKIVFILKGTPKKHYALSYHCYYNIMYPHFASDSKKGCLAPNDEDVKPATKEQRDLLFSKMKEAGYEWDAEKKELKRIEQKTTAWTPMDEQRVENLLAIIEGHGYPGEVAWLNSLKDRVQSKQEWSENDIVAIDCAVEVLSKDLPSLAASIERLKSLRPQNRWKPSDEQMTQLKRHCPDNRPLTSLYEQLKKLREE